MNVNPMVIGDLLTAHFSAMKSGLPINYQKLPYRSNCVKLFVYNMGQECICAVGGFHQK